jgi:prevent-host-death family protein
MKNNRVVSATEFKAKCLALLDEVEKSGGTITVTKRGRPVATVVPAPKKAWKSPRNSRAKKARIIGDIVNTDFSGLWNVVRFLLDTHVLIRWFMDAKRLSREQTRVLETSVRRAEPVGLSPISLLEIAALVSQRKLGLRTSLEEFFADLQRHPVLTLIPVSYEIASEAAALGSLRDPAGRAIVATARAHALQLVTSDQRIIGSNLVSVIE